MNLESRVVRYADLKPCTNAFVDTRTPGSDRKENFTIIGPGVSENPNQHVHVPEPHGFNIGAARQPGGCLTSQHSPGLRQFGPDQSVRMDSHTPGAVPGSDIGCHQAHNLSRQHLVE